MRSQKQMALFGLGGGVALASAAFAIGSQAGGGSAVAGTAATTPAVELAATPAIKQVHLRGPGGEKPLGDLATRLGVEEAKLKAALEDLRPERKEIDGHAAELAKILKLDEAKVRAAMEKILPDERRHRGGPGGPASDELAKELGVSTATLEKAFETLHEQRRAQFAKDLAARLSISPDKVEEVLRDMPHGGRRGHR